MTSLELPGSVALVRTTSQFDARSVPKGLLRAHQVAPGVWGRLVVSEGTVDFVFEDAPGNVITIKAGSCQVIPPGRLHHICPDDDARFAVEFHEEPAS